MNSFRERTKAVLRANFLNALSNGDFDIVHTVNVHERLGEGGKIDYTNEDEEVKIKSASLKKKKDEHGGHKYVLKITVE